ncbi:epoxide hydrolase family protein [Streptomyces sp. URMC 126]|uniref:epoxide hydrolase family protein n=1 Tax=Streptomyces sp. URMC 126 TaxID=3423401 RepID=UPI003F1967CF
MTADDRTRFTIEVPQAELDDLRARLRATRFAPDLDNEDEKYGLSTAYLRRLVELWADGFDWRAAEKRLNTAYTHHRLDIGGTPVHFVREPGTGPAPTPLILTHGWPWTFLDWTRVLGPLADPAAHGGDPSDAFEVIIPSLPGFGFSTPLTNGRENYVDMADRFHTLMTETLGHERYAVCGSDYGALVAAQLAHRYPESVIGVHLGMPAPLPAFQGYRYWDITGGQDIPDGASPQLVADLEGLRDTLASHLAVHCLDAQTLTHGLNDSPAGMLAWILKRWKSWSDQSAVFEDVYPDEHILTTATIYWVTQSIGSSIRAYKNAHLYPEPKDRWSTPAITVPTGFTFHLGDHSSPGIDTPEQYEAAIRHGMTPHVYGDLRHVNVHQRGGHFGPFENPDAWTGDIRQTFRPLR